MMKKIFLLLSIPFMLWSCQQTTSSTSETQEVSEVRDGVFIHISTGTDNPHRLLMALSMANKMADDKDVLVYMDIEAVKVMVKGAEPVSMEPFGNHISMIQALLDQGIEVMVCPGCLQVAGLSPDNLLDGVQLAEKEKFFGFTKGRILSFDY